MVFMHNKRPFSEDEHFQVSFKHMRQPDCNGLLSSGVETASCEIPSKKCHILGSTTESRAEVLANGGTDVRPVTIVEFGNDALNSSSRLPSETCNSGEESSRLESALQEPTSVGFAEDCHPKRALVQAVEFYTSLPNLTPRKLVPIGPDNQAEIPVWTPVKSSVSFIPAEGDTCLYHLMDENSARLMGTCIIPMPDAGLSAQNDESVGCGRNDCSCPDEGSIRCVRQHVMEARKELEEMLGKEIFVELGFSEMGEDVAWNWNEEEEQVFREVIFSNPASSGKNFWDHLSHVFPARTKKDLVSYYFNVFMLCKRAEQNRINPMNVDSDCDEWEGSDDGDCEVEEDEDSMIVALADSGKVMYDDHAHAGDFQDRDSDEDDDDNDSDDDDHNGWLDGVSAVVTDRLNSGQSVNTPSSDCTMHITNNMNVDKDHDLQDDSCTSNEGQCLVAGSFGSHEAAATHEHQVEADCNDLYHGTDTFPSNTHHKYELDACDVKGWEAGFFTTPVKDIEFLPTCNVIKEVFGDESWDN